MSVLITFIKLIAVFDLLVIAVYFGGDILSTMLNKLRRKAKQEDSFDFSQDAMTVSLSIDSIRQLCSGDAADFVAVSYTHLAVLRHQRPVQQPHHGRQKAVGVFQQLSIHQDEVVG